MNLQAYLLAALGNTIDSISISANWVFDTGVSPLLSSIVPTITVPALNPGVLRFEIVGAYPSAGYKKNGGANVAFIDGDTLSVASTDTLQFRTVGAAADELNVNVYDGTTGALIGYWRGVIT